MSISHSPYHEAEVIVQERSGRRHFADALAPRIFKELTPEAAELFAGASFVIVGTLDSLYRPWASILAGPEGFVSAVGNSLFIKVQPADDDPLSFTAGDGGDVGVLVIDFAKRRRYRVNGRAYAEQGGFRLEVDQCYRNCPQYIHGRSAKFMASSDSGTFGGKILKETRLHDEAREIVLQAETFFIASHGSGLRSDDPRLGADVSHRGGNAGFVEVSENGRRLSFPDYIGNFMFNTLGNLTRFPFCGLLFIDFATGRTVRITGSARIDWESQRISATPGAQRIIDVEIEEVLVGPVIHLLKWEFIDRAPDLQRYEVKDSSATAHEEIRAEVTPAGFSRFCVTRVIDEAEDIRSYYLRPFEGSAAPYLPGQHVKVQCRLPGSERPVIRHYSLSDYDPTSNEYRIGIKRSSNQSSGSVSRHIHTTVRPGSSLLVSEPAGQFVLASGNRAVVLISAGVGITPLLSMLKALASRNKSRPVWFLHGARNGAEHAYAAEVRRITDRSDSLHAHFRYSQPRPLDLMGRDHDSEGRIDISLIKSVTSRDAHFYLCGPDAFMAQLNRDLINWGVAQQDIYIESFGPAYSGEKRPNVGTIGAQVSLVNSSVRCTWAHDSHSLLELLEGEGLVVPSSCRSGTCGTCEQKIEAGSVIYAEQPSYAVRPGYALLCCAQPESDVIIDLE